MTTSTLIKAALVQKVRVTADSLVVNFDDGRSLALPLAWYPRLKSGTAKERNHYRLIGRGIGVHWPLLDEDLSAEGLLAGRPSAESEDSFARWRRRRTDKAKR